MIVSRTFVSRFSPNRTDPAVLEAIFVQRHRLAEIWLEKLRDSVLSGVKHHLLAVGPRGCGKSHLVALLVGRLRQDPAVVAQARIAWLPEDETTPSFWKFLLRILRALNAEYGNEFPPLSRDQLTDATEERRSVVLTDYLLKKLHGRTLLVVVENLDDVLRGMKDEGQKRWRAFLQEHQIAATLATAQQLTEDVSNRDRPFFNFFQIEHLKPLTADEALALLRKIAEHTGNTDLAGFLQTPTGRARIRAIRHIAGGSHRVFIILSEFATRENLDDLVGAFNELLDELTPYYQERLRWLPDQQREIVEFLCRQTRTVPVKEIAAELFLTDQTAAAQLKSLKDKGYATAATVGRQSRYELAEPLMRLCVEVKDPQREPLRLIVEFLRIWYDRNTVEARLQCLPANADLERRYFQAVLQAHQPGIPGPVEMALNWDLDAARTTGDMDEVVRVLVELAATADTAWQCVAVAIELDEIGRHAEALTASDRAIELNPDNALSWNIRGFTLKELGRQVEAVTAYDRAIDLKPKDPTAWNGKANALSQLMRHTEALAACEKAIDLNPTDAIAWSNRGFLLNQLKRHAEALAACEMALDLGCTSDLTWNNKGWALKELGRSAEALIAYDRAIELKPDVAIVWSNKAILLNELGQHVEALNAWCRALELDPNDTRAWCWRGLTLASLGQGVEALTAYDCAIEIDSKYVPAWNNKAYSLLQLGRYADALDAANRAIELDPKYIPAWINKGFVLNNRGRYAEALASFDRAIGIDPENIHARHYGGRAKLKLSQIDGAVDDFRHAIKLNGSYFPAFESLAEAYVLQGNWDEAEQVLADRFRLQRLQDNPPRSAHVPDVIVAIFRSSPGPDICAHRVARLAEVAAHANALAELGDSLVRSLAKPSYAESSAEALEAWVGVWQEVAKRHPDLSLATRLFGVGVRYLQTKDERMLLDLVQEERSILRDLFRLDDDNHSS